VKRHQRLVYTSSPDRGLDILLELWPRIREGAPDATFAFSYAPVYFKIAEQDPAVAAHAKLVRELSEQDGVEPLGSLSQPQVARLMMTSLVWCHPSYCTPAEGPFHETSCVSAMEAQAAGCVVVASHWGALSETVKVGRLVSGPAGSARWKDALVAEIVDGLTNPETQAWAQREGPKAADGLGWDGVGVQVAALLRG
jgi:glycosyltransferase involved in cell wall biosynthesis